MPTYITNQVLTIVTQFISLLLLLNVLPLFETPAGLQSIPTPLAVVLPQGYYIQYWIRQRTRKMAFRINIPPVTRILLISLLSLSFLYNVARWRLLDTSLRLTSPSSVMMVPYLPLVPSQFFLYPWTLLTATFVEQNIVTVVLNAATLFYGGKYLERAWGSREFGKFILIVALIPNLLAVPIYLLWRVVTGDEFQGYVFSLSTNALSSWLICWLL